MKYFLPLLILLAFCRVLPHRIPAGKTISEIDIILVPEKYNLLDTEWILGTETAHFKGKARKISHTTHSTAYDYDSKIPLYFYGKWFKKGHYGGTSFQQHIVPQLAAILSLPRPAMAPLEKLLVNMAPGEKPDLIVTVVIDQGGERLFDLHGDVLQNLHQIKNQSAVMTNAWVGHLDTHTATGHAAIGTGAFPDKTGIIANSVFYKGVDGIQEKKAYSDHGKYNPADLKADTLADIFDRAEGNRPVIISQSYAARASIGMAGHGKGRKGGDGDFVYWLSSDDLRWETNPDFYDLPPATDNFNVYDVFNKAYPAGVRGLKPVGPGAIKNKWSHYMATPAELAEEVAVFMKVLQSEIIDKKLDRDGATDIAYLTIKATDAAGHIYGQESDEMKETLAEADKQIGRLLVFLQKHYGDRFALVVTADHGCAPLTEFSGGSKMTIDRFFREVDSLLPETETGSLIRFMTNGQIALDHELMARHHINSGMVADVIKNMKINGKKFFKAAEIISK